MKEAPLYSHFVYQPPLGTPSLTVIKAGITAPISIATASTAMVGIATTLIALIMVIKFRHHTVFKSSRLVVYTYNSSTNTNSLFHTHTHIMLISNASPIICIMELLGLLLSYISVPLFFISSYSIFTCFMLPITFYIGLSLILGTMISRNYRVYKMVNNVYNNNSTSNHHSSSNQLLKISCFILAFNTVSGK